MTSIRDDLSPRVAVVIVNFGSHALLSKHLPVGWAGPDTLVAVVDNWSSSSERASIRALAHDRGWELIERPDNAGFGAAVDEGAARAIALGADTVILLNPDAVLSATACAALAAKVAAEPNGLFAPTLVDSSGQVVFAGSEVQMTTGNIRGLAGGGFHDGNPRRWLSGACLALSRSMWERLGGIGSDFFLYWEDVDLSLRAADLGATLTVCADVQVVHDEGGTQDRGARAKSSTYYYYNCRNRLVFATRHLPRREVIRWMRRTPSASWSILMRGGRRQLVQQPALALAALRGSVAGLALASATLIRRTPRMKQ